jgi:hypothetical protein
MATATPQNQARRSRNSPQEVKVIMHSALLYWWPVWVVGFLMALWTYLDNYHLVLVPEGTVVEANQVLVPEGGVVDAPLVHVARSKVPGAVFVVTLGVVLGMNNGWMRGWRAYFFAALLAALAFLVSWGGLWGSLYEWVSCLDVRINLGGYLVVSAVLFAIWAWFFFVVDRQLFVVFSMSQVRLHNRVLEEERAFDAGGVAFQKQEYDWFRWLVGFGAGDIVLRVGGAAPQIIELANVIHVGRRLQQIERLLRTKDVD